MRTILFSVLLIFAFHGAFCQDTDIEHIRKVYYKTVEEVKNSRTEGYEGSLYCNTQETNKYGKSWRAVGNYNEKVEFWYDDDPTHQEDDQPSHVLQMVIVTGESAVFGYYKEFVFEKGKLIFAFEKFRNEGSADELRYYYKDEKLIKRVVNKDELEKEESKYTIKEANNWMVLFLKSFGL